jgi:CMP-N-acetylneuraminic acid synthetase
VVLTDLELHSKSLSNSGNQKHWQIDEIIINTDSIIIAENAQKYFDVIVIEKSQYKKYPEKP